MTEESIFRAHDSLASIEQQNAVSAIIDARAEREKTSTEYRARLSASQWREIELLWESGEVTLRDLSERYKKHTDTFHNHFKRYGIKKGAKAEDLRRAAEEKVREQTKNDASVISERIRHTKEQHYKMAEAISKLVFNEVLEVRKRGGKYRDIQADLRSLLTAMDTLKKSREERWIVLGLDKDAIDEDAIPELVMSTMTPEQVQALRESQADDDEDFEVDDQYSNEGQANG